MTPLDPCSLQSQDRLPKLANSLYGLTYQENTLSDDTNYLNRLDSYGCAATSNDFYLFEGEWLSPLLQAKVPNKSSDNKYWFWCTNALNGYNFWKDSIIVVKYKLPPLPYGGLYEDVKVSNKEKYDIRFTSVATSDTFGLQPTIDSVTDKQIRNHYMEFDHSASTSNKIPQGNDNTANSTTFNSQNWDGVATIVIARNKSIIEDCQLAKYGILPSSGFMNQEDTESLTSTVLDERVEDRLPYLFLPWENEYIDFPKLPNIIIRQMEAKGETTAGTFSAYCEGGKECGDVNLAKTLLKDYMPTLDVYHCESATETLENKEKNTKSDAFFEFSRPLEDHFGPVTDNDSIDEGVELLDAGKESFEGGKQNRLIPVKINHN